MILLQGGVNCTKYLLIAFNLIFVLAGIGLIVAGTYVQLELKSYFSLIGASFSPAAALLIATGVLTIFAGFFGGCGAFTRTYSFICILAGIGLTVIGAYELLDYGKLVPPSFMGLPSFMIATGVIILCISFLGCYGAYNANRMSIFIYGVLLVIIFLLELTSGITGFVLRSKVREKLTNYLITTLDDEDAWNTLQQRFQCCGISGPNDWLLLGVNGTIPSSCCDNLGVNCDTSTSYSSGCLLMFSDFLKSNLYLIGAVGISLAVVQLGGLILTFVLARAIPKNYEDV